MTMDKIRKHSSPSMKTTFTHSYSGISLPYVHSAFSLDTTVADDDNNSIYANSHNFSQAEWKSFMGLDTAGLLKSYTVLLAEVNRLQKENRLFDQFIEHHADKVIIDEIEEKKEKVRRGMRRRRIFAPIRRVVSEKLNLKKAAGDQPRNLMETMLRAKRLKEEIRLYEVSTLDIWQKIDICLIALSHERISNRTDDEKCAKEYLFAVSNLDLVNFQLNDLRDQEAEFERVCSKSYSEKTETYDADKIKFYFERHLNAKSANLARQLLLKNKLAGQLRSKRMKEKLRGKHLANQAEQNKKMLLQADASMDALAALTTNQTDDRGGNSENSMSQHKTSFGNSGKIQQWMIDKEMMELEKQKETLEKLRLTSSHTGLRLADITVGYQQIRTALKDAHERSKDLTEQIAMTSYDVEALDEEIAIQSSILHDLEVKNLNLVDNYIRPRYTRSAHSQIMLNGEVFELRRQIGVWERKCQIKEQELTNLQSRLKGVIGEREGLV